MPEIKHEPEEVIAVTVRIFRIPPKDAGGWGGTFKAHITDIHLGRPGVILPAGTMSGLARQVAQMLEDRFDRDREEELSKLGRDFFEADSRRAEAEKELTRMREAFGVLPGEGEAH